METNNELEQEKMKKLIASFTLLFLLISFIPAFAEIKTFVKEYTYQASDIDSKISSRTNALEQVKRLLMEELGVYLESFTEVKNKGKKEKTVLF